ncbi:N-6 DNA methylase [Tunturibacter psychrotolerans]|uniref:site-specific DNA-methyltransferase (adenine-specific) n=1 Tax=Tunturiibacter psychrotolerans TaxID=3069686 RepID=A0AAU7ZJ66_9BACT
MTFDSAVTRFLALVKKVEAATTARSENDLSANLASCLQALGLSTVLDTSSPGGMRKRPDILGYVRSEDADLVLPAEIVIESKKPNELSDYATITDAVNSGWFWAEKTVPYIRENLTRIQYFVVTTFTSFAIVTISEELRRGFIEWVAGEDESLRSAVRANTTTFHLCSPHHQQSQWQSWLESHFEPTRIAPVPISTIISAFSVESRRDLESFAGELAGFAAGNDDISSSGLFESVRTRLPASYELLEGTTKRDLHIFLMTQYPGMKQTAVETLAKEHPQEVVSDFVAASIHSLIGRLFAFKVIEDKFCVSETDPLIDADHWIFRTTRYDRKASEEIRKALFRSLRDLKDSELLAIRRFAEYGFFFDWIEDYVDPTLLRRLIEMIGSRNFESLEGDLLGRFFELYAQKINRTKRRALGQYYTPQPVVEVIWSLVVNLVHERGVENTVNVLDPGMGSGTFLTEGVRQLAKSGVPRFWDRLSGFDLSAQVLGIAYVNLYVAILSQLDRNQAEQVGDLHVYATDALDPRNGQYLKQILPLIPDENYKNFIEERIRISAEVKQNGTFTVVIGNPPYRNNSNRTLSQMALVFPALFESSMENSRAQEINPRDDYAWFFGAADFYVRESGIIAFIVSDSFAQKRSYRYFRQDLLRRYHIRHLIRLGGQVFQDVGPRIDFVIVVLEKRSVALAAPNELETHPYIDLRGLTTGVAQNILGTELDPRFLLMQAVSSGERSLPEPVMDSPRKSLNYSLYPVSPIIDRVRLNSLPLFEKKVERIFESKWPGLVTAFDEFFKAGSSIELETRMTTFFELCNRPRLGGPAFTAAVERWGGENAIDEDKYERLCQLAHQVRQRGLAFVASNIKRALDGAMPNNVRWYPPRRNSVFVYYEVRLDIPRNENEGRVVGWGTMQQWREPLSHIISPKLIYTTASKPQYGLKAFVVDDEWYVKKHGGMSQQYNYTGLVNQSQARRMDGSPNNLNQGGLRLLERLQEANLPMNALNFYVAAIYNSEIASEFLEEASSGTPFAIRIPSSNQLEIARDLACAGNRMRDIFWLQHIVEGSEQVEASSLAQFEPDILDSVGLVKQTIQSRGFRSRETYAIPTSLNLRIQDQTGPIQEEIDRLASELYS